MYLSTCITQIVISTFVIVIIWSSLNQLEKIYKVGMLKYKFIIEIYTTFIWWG